LFARIRDAHLLDPAKLNNYGLTPVDVSNAIQGADVQIASGELGGLPVSEGPAAECHHHRPTRLHTPAQFGAILLKVNATARMVRLRDVARIGLGSETYAFDVHYNGKPRAALPSAGERRNAWIPRKRYGPPSTS